MQVSQIRKIKFPYDTEGAGTSVAFAPRLPLRIGQAKPALLFLTQTPDEEPIVFLDPANGDLLGQVFPQDAAVISALEWDGRRIWALGATSELGLIKKLSHRTGNQVAAYPAPWAADHLYGYALAFDDSRIFASAGYYYSGGSKIWILNSSGVELSSFSVPNGIHVDSMTIAHELKALLIGDNSTGKLHALRITDYALAGSADLPGTGSKRAMSLAFDEAKKALFVADESDQLIRVLKVSY